MVMTSLLLARSNLSVLEDVEYTTITNYVAFFGYTVLVWDHIITFGEEVELIWKRKKKNLMTYLFFLNRYFTPFAFIGNLTAYFGEWSTTHCEHFARYEGSCTIIALMLTALMMLFRIRALYISKRFGDYIIGSVVLLLIAEMAVMAWLMTHAIPVNHPLGYVKACTMIFDPNLKIAPSLSAWFPLVYDTYVIILTLHACKPLRKDGIFKSHVMMALSKGGLLYYAVIFCVNLVLAIMIIAAPSALKNICAQLEQLLTVAMISRITLGLMREGRQQDYGFDSCDDDCMYGGGNNHHHHHHHHHHHYSFHCASPPHDGKDLPLSPFRAQPGKRGSATMIQHISVISRSEQSEYSLAGPRTLRELSQAAAAAASAGVPVGVGAGAGGSGRGGVPPVLFGMGAAKRRFERIVGSGGVIGRQLSSSFGLFTPTGTTGTMGTDFGTNSAFSNTNASELGLGGGGGGGNGERERENPYSYYYYYHHAGVSDTITPTRLPPEVEAAAAGLTVPSSASFGLQASSPSNGATVPRVPSAVGVAAPRPTVAGSAPAALSEREVYELRTLRASPLSPASDGIVRL